MQSYSSNYADFGYEIQFSDTVPLFQGKQFFSAAKAGLSQASAYSARSNSCKSQKIRVKSDAASVTLS